MESYVPSTTIKATMRQKVHSKLYIINIMNQLWDERGREPLLADIVNAVYCRGMCGSRSLKMII